MKKILLIIPAFNEGKSLPLLINEILNVNFPPNYIVQSIIVNDGSEDHTAEIILPENFKMINLCYNIGIGGAVQTGLIYARENDYDMAIQVDGDGQHIPLELIKLLDCVNYNPEIDMVIGSRFLEQKEGFKSTFLRRFGIALIHKVIWFLTRQKIYDTTSGFRLFNKRAIDFFSKNYPDEFPEPESLIIAKLIGLNIIEISINMKERIYGKSSITPTKSLYYMIKVILSLNFTYIKTRFGKYYGIYNS